MDEDEVITPDGQADESQLNSPAPEAAASNESTPENLTLAELNAILGKDFKDKATALKSVKDTYSYVGKRKEDIIKEAGSNTQEISRELKELKENMFFDKNPDYAPYRAAFNKVGGNPEDFFNSPELKPLFEKAKGFDENQKLRSVLSSNPRIAASKDNISKAREAMSSGNREEAERQAIAAVLGTLE